MKLSETIANIASPAGLQPCSEPSKTGEQVLSPVFLALANAVVAPRFPAELNRLDAPLLAAR